MKLQVLACDIDQAFPAKTYTLTVSDGRTLSKDLCEDHAAVFEEWLEEVTPDSEPEDEPESQPVVPKRRAPAKKVAAKKAPAKTVPRRRPKITTLDAIEKSKQS